jgi:hypothetical protein
MDTLLGYSSFVRPSDILSIQISGDYEKAEKTEQADVAQGNPSWNVHPAQQLQPHEFQG